MDLNGQQQETNCYVLAFANASQYGDNVYIAPRADLRDGLLDVCLIDALPIVRAFRVSMAMALGNLPNTNAAEYFRVPRGRVVAKAPIGFHVDGDYQGHATEFSVELLPLALAVAV